MSWLKFLKVKNLNCSLRFFSLIVLKGQFSAGYKLSVSGQDTIKETFDKDKVALFRVQGSSPSNMQATQVDPVSGSLNSSYCYILKDATSTFTWFGSLSSSSDHDLIDRLLDQINFWQPLKQCMSVREGNEPDILWDIIGGKVDYPKDKDIKEYSEDPHLFTCILEEGNFKLLNGGIHKTNFHPIRKSSTSDGSCIGRELSSDGSTESSSLAIRGPSNSPAKLEAMEAEDNEENCDADDELRAFPYELLKVSSGTALDGVDVTRREAYLSDEEFKAKFEMTKKAFYRLPKWKQNKLKQGLNLF